MKVKELIRELKECNREAKVTIVVGDYDDNIIDTSNFEIHGKDIEEYIELFVLVNHDCPKCKNGAMEYDEISKGLKCSNCDYFKYY